MFPRVLIVGAYSAFTLTFSNLPFLGNTSGSLFLMMFLWVLSVGVFGVLLLHVELLRLVPSDEHLVNLLSVPSFLLLISLH